MSPRRQPDLLRLVQHPVAPLSSNVVAEPDMGRQALSPDLAKFSHLHTNTESGPSSQATPAGSSDKLEHVEKLLHASLEHDAQQQRLHMDVVVATCLELLLVYTQLGLSLLLAIMQRIQR